jgi:hypothetical protein
MAHYEPVARNSDDQADGQEDVWPTRRRPAGHIWMSLSRVYLVVVHIIIVWLLVLLFYAQLERQDLKLHMLPSEFGKRRNLDGCKTALGRLHALSRQSILRHKVDHQSMEQPLNRCSSTNFQLFLCLLAENIYLRLYQFVQFGNGELRRLERSKMSDSVMGCRPSRTLARPQTI